MDIFVDSANLSGECQQPSGAFVEALLEDFATCGTKPIANDNGALKC